MDVEPAGAPVGSVCRFSLMSLLSAASDLCVFLHNIQQYFQFLSANVKTCQSLEYYDSLCSTDNQTHPCICSALQREERKVNCLVILNYEQKMRNHTTEEFVFLFPAALFDMGKKAILYN